MADKGHAKGSNAFNTAFAVFGYMTCSALMLLVNKLTVHHLPAPIFVILCQLFSSGFSVWMAGKLTYVTVDPLEWKKIKSFWIVPVAFMATLFANIKILQHSNVETFIVFRASTPVILSFMDALFLGRELPSRKSWVCLLGLLAGAMCYLHFETGTMSYDSYFWVGCWYIVFVFDQVYIKHVTDTVQMTTWGRVYYTNMMPVVPMFLYMYFAGEFNQLKSYEPSLSSYGWLVISCVAGVGISYFAFAARAAISATYFTVVGNSCKVITVTLNILIWDKHATAEGILSLFLCLICAYHYEQAPKRAELVK